MAPLVYIDAAPLDIDESLSYEDEMCSHVFGAGDDIVNSAGSSTVVCPPTRYKSFSDCDTSAAVNLREEGPGNSEGICVSP